MYPTKLTIAIISFLRNQNEKRAYNSEACLLQIYFRHIHFFFAEIVLDSGLEQDINFLWYKPIENSLCVLVVGGYIIRWIMFLFLKIKVFEIS
jgi:hypothetical protein